MGYLYRFEVKGIQSFVLAGNKLREMVGASAIIEALTGNILDEQIAAFGGCRKRYAAAGGATLHFDSAEVLGRFAARWPMVVDACAPTITMVQAWVPDDTKKPIKKLADRLNTARNAPPAGAPFATPVIHRTNAGALADARSNKGSYVSTAQRRKLAASNDQTGLQRQLKMRFVDEAGPKIHLPFDIEDMANESDYIGVLHADGNNVGQVVMKIDGVEEMAAFAAALSESTDNAVRAAFAAHLRPDEEGKKALGRPIVIGGDDVTAIVRADRALPFVRTFCAEFAKETDQREAITRHTGNHKGLTASAGIAWVRQHHPFWDAYALAEELCGEAKRFGRGGGEYTRSMVAFHRCSSSLVENLHEIKSHRVLGMGPYCLGDESSEKGIRVASLIALSEVITKEARGPVRELIRILQEQGQAAGEARLERLRTVQKGAWKSIKPCLANIDSDLEKVAGGAGSLADGGLQKRVAISDHRPSGNSKPCSPWIDALVLDVISGRRSGGLAERGAGQHT